MDGVVKCLEELLLVTFLALFLDLHHTCLPIDDRFDNSADVLAMPVESYVRYLLRFSDIGCMGGRTIRWTEVSRCAASQNWGRGRRRS